MTPGKDTFLVTMQIPEKFSTQLLVKKYTIQWLIIKQIRVDTATGQQTG